MKGGLCPERGCPPPVNRQTGVKTLPSPAVGTTNIRTLQCILKNQMIEMETYRYGNHTRVTCIVVNAMTKEDISKYLR